ncbi:CCA tRNA nucleotidyltransferase [Candidatus Falkowbacteria bacterium]|nr:CCA tRNA nucleotidyltransferase [Candidatus Falkowbacteria bacterium]
MIHSRTIHPQIQALAKQLRTKFPAGEVFLVGGPVRDLLLGKPIKDYDLLVRGVPAKPLETFLKSKGQVNLVGKSFGVFKLKIKNSKLEIDVALPRTEHTLAHTGAYRDFTVQSDYRLSVAEDLSRRDFTVNAMAFDLITKKLIDPFGGQRDLKMKQVRAVGTPAKRLGEDYSRILRAVRFACQLNFTIEAKTWSALKRLAPRINQKISDEFVVPRETIAKELLKTFYHNPPKALELLDSAGLVKALTPELLKMKGCPQPTNWHTEGDVWTHTLICLKNLRAKKYQAKFPGHGSATLTLAVLLHDLGKPYTLQTPEQHGTDRIRFNGHDLVGAELADKICERLKLSAYKDSDIDCDPEAVSWIIRHHMLTVSGKVGEMKNTTLEKYFFSERPGAELLRLMYVDAISTVPKNGAPDLTTFRSLEQRLNNLTKLGNATKRRLPRPLLDGNVIMRLLKLKPGPKIGKLITKLREEQLKGKIKTTAAAQAFIRKIHG